MRIENCQYSMHYARIGRTGTQIRPRRKMHDFGDLGQCEDIQTIDVVILTRFRSIHHLSCSVVTLV